MDTQKYKEIAVTNPRGEVVWALIDTQIENLIPRVIQNGLYGYYESLGYVGSPLELCKSIVYNAVWDYGLLGLDDRAESKKISGRHDRIRKASGSRRGSTGKFNWMVNMEQQLVDQWIEEIVFQCLRNVAKEAAEDQVKGMV